MSKNFCKVEHKWCKFCKKIDNGFCCTYNNEHYKQLKNIHKCPKREERETISFRKILDKVNLYDVITEMIKSHPKEKKNILGYASVMIELANKKGIKSDGMLKCERNTYSDGTCIDIFGVWGKKTFAIDFLPWGEWLTMNVQQETLDNFTYEEIVSAALWEMTFNGYTEEKVQNTLKTIENNLEESIKQEKVK